MLERLEQNLPYNLYMQILSTEGELSRLLTVVSAHPSSVFDYGEQLSAEFPQATYELCLEEIRSQAVETGNRRKYKQLCANIKHLFVYGAVAETYGIIDELKAKYPRRSAMLDELQGLKVRLARKQKVFYEFNDLFENVEWKDIDQVKKRISEITEIVAKDEIYQDKMKNSDK